MTILTFYNLTKSVPISTVLCINWHTMKRNQVANIVLIDLKLHFTSSLNSNPKIAEGKKMQNILSSKITKKKQLPI